MVQDEKKPKVITPLAPVSDSAAYGAAGGRSLQDFPGMPPGAPSAASSAKRSRSLRILPLLVVAAVVILIGGFFFYRYWQDQTLYVATENALVTGALVQVGSLNAGQVSSVAVDIGDQVTRNQEVGTVAVPSSLGLAAGGVPKLGFRGTENQQVSVRAPIDGVVVARQGNPGDTVAVGQPILTVVDPARLWVQAQIEETKIGRVHVGAPVEARFDSLNQTLPGRVVAVGRASAATFSLLPQGNSSGNFTKVTQLVPVKIAVDYGQLPLVLGSSVEVKIRAQE